MTTTTTTPRAAAQPARTRQRAHYEHTIYASQPTIIWVWRTDEPRNTERIYMLCGTADEARRRLALLRNGMGKEAVRK